MEELLELYDFNDVLRMEIVKDGLYNIYHLMFIKLNDSIVLEMQTPCRDFRKKPKILCGNKGRFEILFKSGFTNTLNASRLKDLKKNKILVYERERGKK